LRRHKALIETAFPRGPPRSLLTRSGCAIIASLVSRLEPEPSTPAQQPFGGKRSFKTDSGHAPQGE
jgi:hypothetical protein